jgi:hypothetical protein
MAAELYPVLAGFGGALVLALARTWVPLVRFYAEWSRSGLAMAEHRGYGQSACKAFGACTRLSRRDARCAEPLIHPRPFHH